MQELIEIPDIIRKLNEEIYDVLGEQDQPTILKYSYDGVAECIEFLGVVIWDNQNLPAPYNEKTDEYGDKETCIRERIFFLLNDLSRLRKLFAPDRKDAVYGRTPRVTISGHAGSGKTTVAYIIDRAFEKNGITCVIDDGEDRMNLDHAEMCIDSLAGRSEETPVMIDVVQVQK